MSPPGPSGVSVTYSPWVKTIWFGLVYIISKLFVYFSPPDNRQRNNRCQPLRKREFSDWDMDNMEMEGEMVTHFQIRNSWRHGWKLPWEQWVCKFCSLKQPKLALFSNTAICVRAIPKQINRTPMQIWIYDIHVWLEIAETYILIVSLPFAIRYLTIACINSVWCYNSNKFFSFKYLVVYFRNI